MTFINDDAPAGNAIVPNMTKLQAAELGRNTVFWRHDATSKPMVSSAVRAEIEKSYRAGKRHSDETHRAELDGVTDAQCFELEREALHLDTLALMEPAEWSVQRKRSKSEFKKYDAAHPKVLPVPSRTAMDKAMVYEAQAAVGNVDSGEVKSVSLDLIPEELYGRSIVMSESTYYDERREGRAVDTLRLSKRMLAAMLDEAAAAGVIGKVARCEWCGDALVNQRAKYCGDAHRKRHVRVNS